jgi:hypothetical protein
LRALAACGFSLTFVGLLLPRGAFDGLLVLPICRSGLGLLGRIEQPAFEVSEFMSCCEETKAASVANHNTAAPLRI